MTSLLMDLISPIIEYWRELQADLNSGYYSIWLKIGIFFLLGVIGFTLVLIVLDRLSRAKADWDASRNQKPKKAKKKKGSETSPPDSALKGGTSTFLRPQKVVNPKELKMSQETQVTERTREQIQNVVSNVKSISLEERKTLEPSKESIEAELKDSQIIQSLADTLVSQPHTDETEAGRFSKMMVDASLIFDPEDFSK